MKLTIVGSGYVGIVSGAYFAEFGFEVICVDKAVDEIDSLCQGKEPIYEPGAEVKAYDPAAMEQARPMLTASTTAISAVPVLPK